ncbi:GNAT family N-acetyltransferase [Shewanella algae]|uniref:GNAT family N-acetyltransferase n=1 Tax=Shewanella algae TaxID=38313 RepID=UPI001AAC69E8|nr:GNAT family N-acetyltransferase [Shewanella algae]
MIEIYTDRLRIRTLTAQDWPAFLALHCDPEVGRFVREPEPQEQIKAKFEQRSQPWRYESGDWLTLVIEELGSDCFVGLTGFYCVDPELAQAEVGYLLHPDMQGKGYATESLRGVIDWGCLSFNIHKFIGHCANDNLASVKVMEKCGFELEGILRHNFRIGDLWVDDRAYGLLSDERR